MEGWRGGELVSDLICMDSGFSLHENAPLWKRKTQLPSAKEFAM